MGLCLHINHGVSFLKSKPALFRKKKNISFPLLPSISVWGFFFEGEGWLF